MSEFSGVFDIVFKNICLQMQQLDCTLWGNGEEWWLTELLFSPGMHRFQLLEWIFSCLNFNFPKVTLSRSDMDEMVKDFLPVISALGVCGKTDDSVILGSASKSEQLRFWETFFKLLWTKSRLLQDVNNEGDSEGSSGDPPSLGPSQSSSEEEYLRSCAFIRCCASSANMNDLFMDSVNLLQPDVTKDVECILSNSMPERESFSLDKIHLVAKDNHSSIEDATRNFSEICNKTVTDEFSIIPGGEKQGDYLNVSSSADFCNFFDTFSSFFHNDMKPILRSSSQSFGSLGEQFTKLYSKQKLISELLDDLSSVKTLLGELENRSKSLADLKNPSLSLPDHILEEYCEVMQQN